VPETIFITGILGQDGAYLAELALKKGHRVVGGARRSSTMNDWRLRELGIHRDVEIVDFELLEESNIRQNIEKAAPSRIFNLAAQSFVGVSFQQPIFTSNVDGLGVLRVLEAIRQVNDGIRFYQASTSEMYGLVQQIPQTELTPLYPRSPYGVAKVFGHYITRNYREAYNMHASSGILFNHESPLRGEEFVTRKITSTLARIAAGSDEILYLGNLDAQRDWGHARDYVEGMWLITDAAEADDYVLATGRTTTVREFLTQAARELDLSLSFEGEGVGEIARDATGKIIAEVRSSFFRPSEVDILVGDSTKARKKLGWKPTYDLKMLIADMVAAEVRRRDA